MQPVPPLTDAHIASFVGLFGKWSETQIHALRSHIGTHAYLWATAAYLVHHPKDPATHAAVIQLASEARGLFRAYLDDVFKDIDKHTRCKEALRSVLGRSGKRLQPALARRLERAGILEVNRDRHGLCLPIMETYLRDRIL